MKNFNNVFAIIKKYCDGEGLPEEPCLEKVETEIVEIAGTNPLYQYLEVLQELGLIEYSHHTNTILLTDKGKQTEKLFTY